MFGLLLSAVLSQNHGGVEHFAARMRTAEARSTAACEAMDAVDPSAADGKCRINHVVETLGPGRKTAFIVFFAHGWDYEAEGKALGHFESFDAEGQQLPWFQNANVLEPGDELVLTSGEPAVLVQRIRHEACADGGIDSPKLQTLHVISLSDPERPLLNLVVGPPSSETVVVREHPANCASVPAKRESSIVACTQEIDPVFTWTWSLKCTATSCKIAIAPRRKRSAM